MKTKKCARRKEDLAEKPQERKDRVCCDCSHWEASTAKCCCPLPWWVDGPDEENVCGDETAASFCSAFTYKGTTL